MFVSCVSKAWHEYGVPYVVGVTVKVCPLYLVVGDIVQFTRLKSKGSAAAKSSRSCVLVTCVKVAVIVSLYPRSSISLFETEAPKAASGIDSVTT